jgi:hypothetical protein
MALRGRVVWQLPFMSSVFTSSRLRTLCKEFEEAGDSV